MTRVLSAVVGACALVWVAQPVAAGERLQLVERAMTDATVDLGPKGDSAGDLLTFANPVYDAANKIQVGSDQGYCVRVAVGKSWECTWTLILAGGEITVEGPFLDSGDSVLVVTGGSAKYAGARGTMKLHARDAKATAFDFIYDLL